MQGWEVMDVPKRTYIMLHPANIADELGGCIAPGLGLGTLHGRWAVTGSLAAFERVMGYLSELVGCESPVLEISWAV